MKHTFTNASNRIYISDVKTVYDAKKSSDALNVFSKQLINVYENFDMSCSFCADPMTLTMLWEVHLNI